MPGGSGTTMRLSSQRDRNAPHQKDDMEVERYGNGRGFYTGARRLSCLTCSTHSVTTDKGIGSRSFRPRLCSVNEKETNTFVSGDTSRSGKPFLTACEVQVTTKSSASRSNVLTSIFSSERVRRSESAPGSGSEKHTHLECYWDSFIYGDYHFMDQPSTAPSSRINGRQMKCDTEGNKSVPSPHPQSSGWIDSNKWGLFTNMEHEDPYVSKGLQQIEDTWIVSSDGPPPSEQLVLVSGSGVSALLCQSDVTCSSGRRGVTLQQESMRASPYATNPQYLNPWAVKVFNPSGFSVMDQDSHKEGTPLPTSPPISKPTTPSNTGRRCAVWNGSYFHPLVPLFASSPHSQTRSGLSSPLLSQLEDSVWSHGSGTSDYFNFPTTFI